MVVFEWANPDPRGKLDIPPELLATQRYRWSARTQPEGMPLIGTCAEYEVLLNGIRLVQVLTDTSERAQGITLKRRVTYRAEMLVMSMPVLIFPFNPDEADGAPHDERSDA